MLKTSEEIRDWSLEFQPPGFVFNCAMCCFNNQSIKQSGNVRKLAAKVTRKAFMRWSLFSLLESENTGDFYCECFTGNVQSLCVRVFVLVRNVYTACGLTS